MMYWGGGGWWWMLLWIVAAGAIIWFIVWATASAGRRGSPGGETPRTPLDIAKERYAKGEITREEFEQIKRDLL